MTYPNYDDHFLISGVMLFLEQMEAMVKHVEDFWS